MKFGGAGTQPPQRIRLLQQLMEMGFKVRICAGVFLCHLHQKADTVHFSVVCLSTLSVSICLSITLSGQPSSADDTCFLELSCTAQFVQLTVSKDFFSIEDWVPCTSSMTR